MFDAIIGKLTELNWTAPRSTAPRSTTVVIPLDRPDLMADAGYDGLRYQGPVPRKRAGKEWLAASWMPFHTAAG